MSNSALMERISRARDAANDLIEAIELGFTDAGIPRKVKGEVTSRARWLLRAIAHAEDAMKDAAQTS